VMRENESAVQNAAASCKGVLAEASSQLKVLDPEVGDTELIQAVAVEALKLRT
jgi:hypothetical protein